MVRAMLSVRYQYDVCSICLSVTLVYCGQTAGWIMMPLGMEVGLGPEDVVLEGTRAPPPQKMGTAPTFRPMSVVAKRSPISATARHLFLFHMRCVFKFFFVLFIFACFAVRHAGYELVSADGGSSSVFRVSCVSVCPCMMLMCCG